jgi:hypothetical protein
MQNFEQHPGESREAFVRRFSNRPGVVADGTTLVDLYNRCAILQDRIVALEERLERLEGKRD